MLKICKLCRMLKKYAENMQINTQKNIQNTHENLQNIQSTH
jgi:hypothetical protein